MQKDTRQCEHLPEKRKAARFYHELCIALLQSRLSRSREKSPALFCGIPYLRLHLLQREKKEM